jgi:hypothetical protein
LRDEAEIKTLLCAAKGTADHQRGSEVCTVYGISGIVGFMKSAEYAKWLLVLEACTKEEHCVIHFLGMEDNKPIEICCCMKYSNMCLSL